MKRSLFKMILMSGLCLFLAAASFAQVKKAEYYFDNDPGFGNGTTIGFFQSAKDTTFSFSAGINSLSNGIHRLFVRSYDSVTKAWSQSIPKLFFKTAIMSNPLANITHAEYFFDTDPGVGSATPALVSLGTDVTISFGANIAALSSGIHQLFVRTRDANGRWSLSNHQFFYKELLAAPALANVTNAEYFFDTDPGFGNATPVSFTAGTDLSFSFSGNIAALSNGVHKLFVRTQDANGKWSHSKAQIFYKEAVATPALANINKLEYFFDSDPGVGNGTTVTVTPGQDIVAFNFTAPISALGTGIHRLYVRSMDANGKWSITNSKMFYKETLLSSTLANINKLEYFIDTDPGVGMATDVPVTAAQNIVAFNFTGNISALPTGIHRLYLRSRDVNGKWSITNSVVFYKEQVQNKAFAKVDKMEYFFDTDPGFGNGNNISFVPGQDISFTFNPFIVSLTTSSFHRLFIRSRDSSGLWSLTSSQLFFIPASLPAPPVKITKLEYYIDTDPGFGSGTNVPVTPGLDVTINFTAPITGLGTGIHQLVVRSQDSAGRWSHSSNQLFYKESVQSPLLVNITKAEYFIDTDPGIGAATNIPVTAGQDITFSFSGSLSGLSTGIHRLYLRTRDANGKWSHSQPQMFFYEPTSSHPLANIVAAEYFIDTDPGIGAATGISFTAGQDVSFGFTGSLTGVGNGLHRLFVRTKDANGKWSLTQPQLFYYEPVSSHPLANIVKAEYFIDTDPGIGAATAVSVTAGQDINIPFTAAISSLGSGMHRLIVRTQDANGIWSHSIPQLFYNEPIVSHSPGYLSQLEYFWDVDTGFGNNTPVSVSGSTLDLVGHSFTAIVPSGFVGKHYLFVRAKDDWGLTTVKEVVFPSSSLPVTLLDFRAQKEGTKVQLSWNVAHEEGMAKYVVERSRNGKDFDSIGMVLASGASDYELYDLKPFQGLNFYRLRQVENSGQIKYSATLTILFSEMASTLSVYPNPATDHFSINASKALSTVTLTDLNGKTIRKYDVSGDYPLNGIASGVYIIQVLDADGVVILKPLVVK